MRVLVPAVVLFAVLACAESEEPSSENTANGSAGRGADKDPQNGNPDDLLPSERGPQLPLPDAGGEGARDAGSSRPAMLDLANCPDVMPEVGSSCEAPPLLCSYGDSMVAGCRTYVQCPESTGTWEASDIPTKCMEAPKEQCPETVPTGPCPHDDSRLHDAPCVYADGTYCYCEAVAWDCKKPPASGCPTSAPNFGDTCEEQGLGCKYGDPCRSGFTTICRDGYWQPVGIGCP